MGDDLLRGVTVLCVAVYVPGILAAARLRELGASVTVVQPPSGDPLRDMSPTWYEAIHRGNRRLTLDLKSPGGRAELTMLLETADVLITALRPAALERLGLARSVLQREHPQLCHVMIVGDASLDTTRPGHDLTYQAGAGLVSPPHMPRALLADVFGSERAAFSAVSLILARDRGNAERHAEVSLASAAIELAAAWDAGLTAPGGVLGGAHPGYRLYRSADGWIAVAALEAHFWDRLLRELQCQPDAGPDDLAPLFASRTAHEWEGWATERDLPIVAVRNGEEFVPSVERP